MILTAETDDDSYFCFKIGANDSVQIQYSNLLKMKNGVYMQSKNWIWGFCVGFMVKSHLQQNISNAGKENQAMISLQRLADERLVTD